jgi:voltage-gated potassium channel
MTTHQLKNKVLSLTQSLIFKVISGILLIWIIGAGIIMVIEGDSFSQFGNSLWWTIVTMTTVGYGDMAPVTPYGRILAIMIMFSGITLIAIVTGTISSIFTTKRIMEGRGLEALKLSDHIVICGWNHNIEKIIQSLNHITKNDKSLRIALVNDLPEDEMNSIMARFSSIHVKYVRGDYALESILKKANINKASSAIIISDDTVSTDDDKTILATLTIKNMAPDLKVIAHVAKNDKIPYLRRANADAIITNDNFESFMVANHVLQPGIPQAVEQLLDVNSVHHFKSEIIPAKFIGKPFAELFQHFREKDGWNCIGLYNEEEKIGVSDFLSADSNALDRFIEQKIKEAGHSLAEESKVRVMMNPADDRIVKKGEGAIIIP